MSYYYYVKQINKQIKKTVSDHMMKTELVTRGTELIQTFLSAIKKLSLVSKLINEKCYKYVNKDSFNGGINIFAHSNHLLS